MKVVKTHDVDDAKPASSSSWGGLVRGSGSGSGRIRRRRRRPRGVRRRIRQRRILLLTPKCNRWHPRRIPFPVRRVRGCRGDAQYRNTNIPPGREGDDQLYGASTSGDIGAPPRKEEVCDELRGIFRHGRKRKSIPSIVSVRGTLHYLRDREGFVGHGPDSKELRH